MNTVRASKLVSSMTAGPLVLLLGALSSAVPARAQQPGLLQPPLNLSVTVTGSTVTFTWNPPASGDSPTSYRFEAGSATGLANITQFDTGSVATSLMTTAVPNGSYYVRLRSRRESTVSNPSNEVTVIVGAAGCAQPPDAPTNLTSTVNGTTVTLTWLGAASGCSATSYHLEVGSVSGSSNLGVFSSAVTQLSAEGVASGTYFVRVRSVNALGTSLPSSETRVIVGAGPAESICQGIPAPPAGTGFVSQANNVDAFGGLLFINFLDPLPHGCRVVDAGNGHPVHDGTQSLRFELHGNDCNSSLTSPDCETDRSRYEIFDHNRGESADGRVVTYEYWVYVPPRTSLRPRGGNILFISQMQTLAPDTDSLGGVLAYLEVGPDYQLMVRLLSGINGPILSRPVVLQNPVDTWNKITWEIGGSSQPTGFLRVYVNDVLKVNQTQQTLLVPGYRLSLKIGIYNAFRSQAIEPFGTQVVYFDGIRKSIR